jgi:hypothetical protein
MTTRKYTKKELAKMTLYELQNVCRREKLVNGYINFNERESLINTILRYRGLEEKLFINKLTDEKYYELLETFIECEKIELKNISIEVPAKIQIYKGIGITKKDNYILKGQNISEGNALLVDPNNNYIYGMLNIEKTENSIDEYYLTGDKTLFKFEEVCKKPYALIIFNKKSSDYIYNLINNHGNKQLMTLEYYKVIIPEIEIREIEETNAVLCIDLGTSNTAVGVYLDENYIKNIPNNLVLNKEIKLNDINFVQFKDNFEKGNNFMEIVPTLVYVYNCEDKENIKYLYGYDAQNRIKEKDYLTLASTFRDIKRWIGNYNKEEEIQDEFSNITKVKRGDIIRAFLLYIINQAENQFKCKFKNLHLTTPVKLSNQYIKMFKDVLPDYEIEEKESLNEGMAVLYNTIFNQIKRKNFYDDEEYKALVIDSGGGTTDLSSCSYKICEGDISYNVYIKTGFENGDTNFGGNNITYRILQFLKIILANYYTKNKITTIDEIIEYADGDIFRIIDEYDIKKIYENLEKKYEEVENIIPTRYKEYENKTLSEYKKIKNNFYFLWELSEMMKKEFFKKTNILRCKFTNEYIEKVDSDMEIIPLNSWNLSIRQNGNFITINDFPDVVFNIKEIIKLIKGDIYEVIRRFLEPYYDNRELTDYSIIKLSGQSSKIDVFKDAIKEFVPGRSIEFKQKNSENFFELKLACLRGVINYINNKRNGTIVVDIENAIPIVPYSLFGYSFTGEEVELFESQLSLDELYGQISRPISAKEIKFYLRDIEGEIKRQYIYINNIEKIEETSPFKIVEETNNKISQEDTDNIKNGEIRYFVISKIESWGFYILPIMRKDEKLYKLEEKFYDFDYEVGEYDFFNGLK